MVQTKFLCEIMHGRFCFLEHFIEHLLGSLSADPKKSSSPNSKMKLENEIAEELLVINRTDA